MKINNVSRYIFLSIIVLLFVKCNNNPNENNKADIGIDMVKLNSERPNLNISILFDLSDRIDPNTHTNSTMEYYQRDIGYVSSISKAYLAHIMNKKVRNINDRIQIYFDPMPANPAINQIANKLKVDLNKDNITKDKLVQIKDNYEVLIENIYDLAINANSFPGSNIWGFFRNKVKSYCIREGYRNVIIILTDGYIYHDNAAFIEGNRSSYLTPNLIRQNNLNNSNWDTRIKQEDFGFIKANSDLKNLEVLVIGLNPKADSPYDADIIKEYWSKWLDEMGVQIYEFKMTDLPSNLDESISEFIWNE